MDYIVHRILQARIIEYWRGLPFPSLGDLPNPGFKSRSPAFQADSLPAEPPGKPPKSHVKIFIILQCAGLDWRFWNQVTENEILCIILETSEKLFKTLSLKFFICKADLYTSVSSAGRGRGWGDLGEWH